MPMSMRIQFPLQFNAFNVRLVVAGSCVTLFKSQISYGELIISFGRARIPFGEKFIIAFGRQINPVLFLALTFFRETMDYLVLETTNKAITSPVFVEQRHLIERVECFCCFQYKVVVHVVRLYKMLFTLE